MAAMRRLLVAMAAAGSLAAAGCGDEGGTAGAAGDQPDDKAQLAFARCMREQGIEIPDPGPGGRPQGFRARIRRGTPPAKLRGALEECRKKTGGGPPPLSKEQQTELRDAALKFARCMRANGIDIPDPGSAGEGPGIVIGGPNQPRLNPRSPAFRRAEQKCRKHLPRMRREGGGGPGPAVEVAP